MILLLKYKINSKVGIVIVIVHKTAKQESIPSETLSIDSNSFLKVGNSNVWKWLKNLRRRLSDIFQKLRHFVGELTHFSNIFQTFSENSDIFQTFFRKFRHFMCFSDIFCVFQTFFRRFSDILGIRITSEKKDGAFCPVFFYNRYMVIKDWRMTITSWGI